MIEEQNNTTLEPVEDNVPAVCDNNSKIKEEVNQIIDKMVDETNIDRLKDLTQLFNAAHAKKNALRISKYDELLDIIEEKAKDRILNHSDEITDKEFIEYMNLIQGSIEKAQRSFETLDAKPIVQINQQTNNVKVNVEPNALSRDSKENVIDAVKALLAEIKKNENQSTNDSPPSEGMVVEAEEVDYKED